MKLIQINDQNLILHHYGAVYWKEKSCLLVADVHLGKSVHFRKNGSAIPSFTDIQNYHKLDQLLNQLEVKRLIFLGDLFHSVYNSSWSVFTSWVSRQQCEIDLVVGNHDIIPDYYFKNIGIQTHQMLQMGTYSFTHHPLQEPEFFNFCGHLHPGYRLRGGGKQYLNLSCFYQQKKQLILPALGSFTGHYYIQPQEDEHVFVLADEDVFEV